MDIKKFPSEIKRGMFITIKGKEVESKGKQEISEGQKRASGEEIKDAATNIFKGLGIKQQPMILGKVVEGGIKGASSSIGIAKNIIDGKGGIIGRERDKYGIILPIPEDIEVSYSAEWSGKNLTPIEYGVREIVEGGGSEPSYAKAGYIFGSSTIGGIAALVGGSSLVNTFTGALGGAGIIINPYKQVMYDSPRFREFLFSWTLSPKSEKEMEEIQEIIWVLKRSMHPKAIGEDKIKESYFWGYPDYVEVKFITDGVGKKDNPWLFNIARSAIVGVDIDYDNKYHRDGTPTGIKLTLSLMETIVYMQKDFGENYENKKNI